MLSVSDTGTGCPVKWQIHVPVPGNIQGPVGWGCEQSDQVEGVPGHCRGLGLDDLKGPF